MVSGSRDRNVLLWDMKENGALIETYSGHEFTVMSVQLDGQRIVSASGDQTIKVWDIQRSQCETTLSKHTQVVMSVCADQEKIVSGSADKTVIVWDFLRGI